MDAPAPLVIGVGNELRGDDGLGIAVVRHLRRQLAGSEIELRELQGEPIALLDTWRDRDVVVIVDAMRSEAPPGTIRRFDACSKPLPGDLRGSTTTHALSLREAIELGRALGQLPRRLTVIAVEGDHYGAGSALSGEVRAAVAEVAAIVRQEAVR
ncbi:MAG: hydrogenase maturation protease [Solirubrobacteraceae bacterium]